MFGSGASDGQSAIITQACGHTDTAGASRLYDQVCQALETRTPLTRSFSDDGGGVPN